MSASTVPTEISRLSTLQQRISIFTWLVVLLLSLRGLFAFYGMQQKGTIEQVVNFVTEPVVQLFSFSFLGSLGDIPAITVFFAAISLLLVSYSLQIAIKYTDIRLTRARIYVVQRPISVK